MSVCTPKSIVEVVRSVFGEIDLDPCDHPDSVVGARVSFRRPEHDGLKESWWGHVYVNPPWGYDYLTVGEVLVPWLQKCNRSRAFGDCSEIIARVPTAVHTPYWRDLVFPFVSAICFAHDPAALVSKYGALGPVHVAYLHYGYGEDSRLFTQKFSGVGDVVVNVPRRRRKTS